VTPVDPRLVAAIERQLRRRTGQRVGWKLGIGDRERIGDHIAVGHLTAATRLDPGAWYAPADGADLHADAEVAVEIGPGGRIAAYGAALELVDLSAPPDTPEEVVAANLFHRAVAFAPTWGELPPEGVEARLLVNGEVRDAGRSAPDLAEKVRAAAEILAAVREALEPGDLVITGSVVQVAVAPGDRVEADLGELGSVSLQVLARS
jgi:2-keto-4-pentenoate hydratase/2-oxohepta-3-ene-1,7-dioic acid hydratase in catechol pathway